MENNTAVTEVTAENTVHPFERAGLGKAPYHVVGTAERTHHCGDHVKAGGCCKYCYTGIRWAAVIQSSDGVIFDVGMDCVEKVDHAAYLEAKEAYKALRAEMRAQARAEARARREAEDAVSRADRERLAEIARAENEAEFRELYSAWAGLLDVVLTAPAGTFAADYAARVMHHVRETGRLGNLHSNECYDCKGQSEADFRVAARLRGLRAEMRATGHVGAVGGKRQTFEAEYVARVSWDTRFGRKSVYKFEVARPDGTFALLTWETGSVMMVGDEIGANFGARLKITATVKAHGDYKGTAQTELTRPKFEKL